MNDICVIQLGGKRGGFAAVDADRFEELNADAWHLDEHGYPARKPTTGKEYLHQRVNRTPPGFKTDHRNQCKIDNTCRNLRACAQSQNVANQTRLFSGVSKYKGVSWNKRAGKWVAQITVKWRRINLGYFVEQNQAALAYNQAAVKHFGEFARLNPV